MGEIQFENIYQEACHALEKGKYSSAIEKAAGLLALAEWKDVHRYLFLSKYILGQSYFKIYRYRDAMEKYMDLTNMFLDRNFAIEEIELPQAFFDRVRFGMAQSMYSLGDLDGAYIILTRLLEKCQDQRIMVDSALLFGQVNFIMYDLDSNLDYLLPMLEMYLVLLEEGSLSRSKKGEIYHHLAQIFTYQRDFQRAQEMLNNSVIHAGSSEELAIIYCEMARINLLNQKVEKTSKHLERAANYLEAIPETRRSEYYLVQGLYYRELSVFADAQRFLEKSLSLAKEQNKILEQMCIFRELAVLYENMNNERDSEYFLEYQKMKKMVNLVKESCSWEKLMHAIKERVS